MEVETWDADFDLPTQNFNAFAQTSSNSGAGGAPPSISSRLSVHSENVSIAGGGDEDWNLMIDAEDEGKAVKLARETAGITLPSNVPASALLGGTIKRLGGAGTGAGGGRKTAAAAFAAGKREGEDWGEDIEMPDTGVLQLKGRNVQPSGAFSAGSGFETEEYDDFDELEGSLGIRFAGRDALNRSSSVSAMSPSLRSVTAESEDDLKGLELPEGQMDFEAILMKKRRAAEAELSDLSQPSPALEQIEATANTNTHKKSKLLAADDNEEYLNDFDLGTSSLTDPRRRGLNKNLKIKHEKPATALPRAATTINFHSTPTDKPMHSRSNIPRPVSGSKPHSRLEPVSEHGLSNLSRERRQQPPANTSGSAQFLRSKRSMPVLRSQQPTAASTQKQTASLHPTSTSAAAGAPGPASQIPPPHRSMAYHLRRESDPRRLQGTQSPPPRSHSRLSNIQNVPDTPSRHAAARQHHHHQRPDLAPNALVREAASKRTLTRPARRRNYGEGNELDVFDDLPTSNAKESKFVKAPVARGPPRQGMVSGQQQQAGPGLRSQQSRGDLREGFGKRPSALPDRMVTTPAPTPRLPASPAKDFQEPGGYTPSYLRDTAASRIARETRLTGGGGGGGSIKDSAGPRPVVGTSGAGAGRDGVVGGPLQPLSTNWKAHVAARSPFTSPSAVRKGKGEKARVQPQLIRGVGAHVAKTEKGMFYNPQTLRWEGNENTLHHFELPPPTSATLTPMSSNLYPALETPTPTSHAKATSYLDRHYHHHQPAQFQAQVQSSPPRPALIAPMAAAGQAVQVNGGMVFDPRQMKWLKMKLQPSGAAQHGHNSGGGKENLNRDFSGSNPGIGSPSVASREERDRDLFSPSLGEEDEEDAFAGIEDLKDEFAASPAPFAMTSGTGGGLAGGLVSGMGSPISLPATAGTGQSSALHEEFDLGPRFIESQVAEEGVWRRKCGGWFPGGERRGDSLGEGREGWRWRIRSMVGEGL